MEVAIMWQMLFPILIVVASNTLYNICAKSTPQGVSPFASLALTYGCAALLALLFFFLSARERPLLQEWSRVNWTAFALSAAIVFLEFGYICIYRAGWKVSTASLVANLSLACILLFVGALLYRETISPRQLAGIAVCAVGLLLIGK